MKKLLLATTLLASAALLSANVAKADIVLLGATPQDALIDLSGQGFGAFPRLLTLQTSGTESGSVTPVDVVHGDAIAGANKSTTPTLTALGWTSGGNVGIAFNADQTGQSGITLNTLVLTIYNGTTAVTGGTFSLASAIDFSAGDLSLEKGNGNGVFAFGLDAAEQLQFNTITAMLGSNGFFAGLSSSLGSPLLTNDGPDSFVGFNRNAAVPGPIVGAGIPSLITALFGMIGLRYRRRRNRLAA